MANSREPKLLKAWARYDGNGELVPSSIIYRKRKPSGKFKELVDPAVDPCCPLTPTTTAPSCSSLGLWVDAVRVTGPYGGNYLPFIPIKTLQYGCDVYSFIDTSYANPVISFPSGDNNHAGLLTKYAGDGSVLYNKAYQFFSPTFIYPYYGAQAASSTVDAEGNVYLLYTHPYTNPTNLIVGVAKLNPSGGVEWYKLYKTGDTYSDRYYFYYILYHPNGYLYLSGGSSKCIDDNCLYDAAAIVKMSPVDGSIDSAKRYYNIFQRGEYTYAYDFGTLSIDPTTGDLLLPYGLYYYTEYGDSFEDIYPLCVIRVDEGLNFKKAVYGVNLERASNYDLFYPDFECTTSTTDRFGSFYGVGWFSDLIKINANDTFVFDYTYLSTYWSGDIGNWYSYYYRIYDIAVDGDTMWLIINTNRARYKGVDAPDGGWYTAAVFNCDLSGNVRWATAFEYTPATYTADYSTTGSNFNSPIKTYTAKDGILYLTLQATALVTVDESQTYLNSEEVLKISNDQVTGTNGDLTFVDITNYVTRYTQPPIDITELNMTVKDVSLPEWDAPYTFEDATLSITDILTTL